MKQISTLHSFMTKIVEYRAKQDRRGLRKRILWNMVCRPRRHEWEPVGTGSGLDFETIYYYRCARCDEELAAHGGISPFYDKSRCGV